MVRFLSVLALGLFYSGCTPVSNSDGIAQAMDPEMLDRTETILGQDRNSNGVRDDVEDYINKNIKQDIQMPLKFFAKSIQATLKADTANQTELKEAVNLNSIAQKCLELALSEQGGYTQQIIDVINILTINTGQRFVAAIKYSDAVEHIHPSTEARESFNCSAIGGI